MGTEQHYVAFGRERLWILFLNGKQTKEKQSKLLSNPNKQ
jgi:hypothetical protein